MIVEKILKTLDVHLYHLQMINIIKDSTVFCSLLFPQINLNKAILILGTAKLAPEVGPKIKSPQTS